MKFIKYQKHWLATVKLLTNSGPKETSNEVISAPLHSQNTLLVVCNNMYTFDMYFKGVFEKWESLKMYIF